MQCNLTKMQQLAVEIAKNSQVGDAIFLNGDLGVGKTTFARFVIQYFLPNSSVTSPTFNIVNVYTYKTSLDYHKSNSHSNTIWHFDLYRLKRIEELYDLGIEEALTSGISIIEWPEIALPMIRSNIINVEIDFAYGTDDRMITITKN